RLEMTVLSSGAILAALSGWGAVANAVGDVVEIAHRPQLRPRASSGCSCRDELGESSTGISGDLFPGAPYPAKRPDDCRALVCNYVKLAKISADTSAIDDCHRSRKRFHGQ